MQKYRHRKGTCGFFKSFDLYGKDISLTFKKQFVEKTWFGAFVTVVVMGIFSAFSMVRTQKFFSGDDPFLSMIDHPSDNVIDLVKAGFAFSITKLKPEYGRIHVTHVQWGTTKDKVKTSIKLVDCSTIQGQMST